MFDCKCFVDRSATGIFWTLFTNFTQQPIEHGDQHIGGGIDLNRVEFTGRRAILENIIDGRFEPFSGLSLDRYTCAVPIGRTHRAGP
jgi:hypothetical protein